MFSREWAYIHRNLSGKYRVSKLSDDAPSFDVLKRASDERLSDGVYVYLGNFARVELAESTVDADELYLANGGFNEKRFQLLSYCSGEAVERSSEPYLAPPGRLPASETQGRGALDVQGNCLGNLPPLQSGYIPRPELEKKISSVLCDDHHPIITLVGRGGIGKTWLALTVLHALTGKKRFDSIVWFSARDIDLFPEGSKSVRPHVLDERGIAQEFTKLVAGEETGASGLKPIEYLTRQLGSAKEQLGTTLFVFDNFETVTRPGELFKWIDTYLRMPNKALITTRFRDFNADYSIDIPGMTEEESEKLIAATAERLGITGLLSPEYVRELVRESDGHPYVLKILLGELAKASGHKKVERIIAAREDILAALFERTFTSLSPAATRVFLLLSNWRSTVPRLAIEAVMLRAENERMDVPDAIEDLSRSSFVELVESCADGEMFVSVPLVAAIFGKQKLEVSPMKTAVMADTELLHLFGAASARISATA